MILVYGCCMLALGSPIPNTHAQINSRHRKVFPSHPTSEIHTIIIFSPSILIRISHNTTLTSNNSFKYFSLFYTLVVFFYIHTAGLAHRLHPVTPCKRFKCQYLSTTLQNTFSVNKENLLNKPLFLTSYLERCYDS